MGGTLECSRAPPQPFGAEAPCHAGLKGLDHREALLADLSDVLQQHCERLGRHIDERLAAHHGDLLRHLGGSEDRWHGRASGQPQPSKGEAAFATQWQPEISPLRAVACSQSGKQEGVVKPAAPCSQKCEQARSGSKASSLHGDSSERSQTDYSYARSFGSEDEMRRRRLQGVVSNNTPMARIVEANLTRKLIEKPWFEAVVCLLIISNVISLGIEVQVGMGNPEEELAVFRVSEIAYTTFFTLELFARVMAYGCASFFVGENRAWNLIDFALVFIALLELALEMYQGSGTSGLDFARILRMFKTVRVFRVIRIMKFFRPLRILVYSLASTVKSLFWTLVLLVIIIYLFGVLFTMSVSQSLSRLDGRELSLIEEHFGSLWMTAASLFKSITGGMDWHVYSSTLEPLGTFWVVVFMAFIAFCHLALLNVVTGVVCQGALEGAEQDQDIVVQSRLALKEKYVDQFRAVFQDIDVDRSGSITLQKFEDRMQDKTLRDYFDAMDLTTDEAWSLFKLLDVQDTCAIDISDFVSGCLRLRGTARSVDVHMLRYESKWTMRKLASVMRSVEELRGNRIAEPRLPMRQATPSTGSTIDSPSTGHAPPCSGRPVSMVDL